MKTATVGNILIALSAGVLYAGVEVDPIFSSCMVLQQGKPVPVTGTFTGKAAPIEVSFGGQTVRAVTKGKKWRAVLEPMEASAEGRDLVITQGSDTVTLNDVLVGEVWLASGQSNMLWRLNQTGDSRAIAEAENPQLRLHHAEPQVHTSPKVYTDTERETLKKGEMYKGDWATCTPTSVPRMSAVAFYFARGLQRTLNVPVGIIHASLGGSEMMAWMPPSVAGKKYRECLTPRWLESDYMSEWVRGRARFNNNGDIKAPHPYQPTYLYRTGIEPWTGFPIAGVIWYQGESDAEILNNRQNIALLRDLINGWRAEFRTPGLPFLMVQLPRINDNTPLRAYWPEFRQVQTAVADELKNVHCAVTVDLGSTNRDVHPPRKLEVGERLAAIAAKTVYGKDVAAFGPTVTSCKSAGKEIILNLEHADGLKTTDGEAPRHFEVAGSDRRYRPANAVIEGSTIRLSSPEVAAPTAARYAWATFLTPNVVNAAGLPMAPYTAEKASK